MKSAIYRQVIDAGPAYRQQFLSLLDQVAAKELDNPLVLAFLAPQDPSTEPRPRR